MKNKYEIIGNKVAIHLNSGRYITYVSLPDLEKVDLFPRTWTANTHAGNKIYVVAEMGKSNPKLRLHRWILNPPAGMFVDHINGDTLDNTRENLSIVTPQENAHNRGASYNSTTKHKNVYQSGKGLK